MMAWPFPRDIARQDPAIVEAQAIKKARSVPLKAEHRSVQILL
jgi:hypothetical protein